MFLLLTLILVTRLQFVCGTPKLRYPATLLYGVTTQKTSTCSHDFFFTQLLLHTFLSWTAKK